MIGLSHLYAFIFIYSWTNPIYLPVSTIAFTTEPTTLTKQLFLVWWSTKEAMSKDKQGKLGVAGEKTDM